MENPNIDISEKKPKRKLTEKQLQALKKGREKRAQKLAEKKAQAKHLKEGEKQMVKENKEQLKEKRFKKKQQEKVKAKLEENHKIQLEKGDEEYRKKARTDYLKFKARFNELKYETLDKIEDKKQFHNVKRYFAKIKLDDYQSEADLKSKVYGDLVKIDKHLDLNMNKETKLPDMLNG